MEGVYEAMPRTHAGVVFRLTVALLVNFTRD